MFRHLGRRDLVWAGLLALVLTTGGVAYAAALPGTYNCVRTDRADGFGLDCVTAATPAPSASPTATSSPSPTVAPSATPSPSATATGPLVGCFAAPARCGFPDASTTGPTGVLAVVGGQTVSTAGATLANLDIRGCVVVNAANVTIRNVKVSGCGDYVRVRSNGGNLTLVDVEVDCGGGYGMGVGFRGYTLVRADIHNCENGGHIDGAVTVRDSWIHDLGGGADGHFDGFQFGQGAAAVTIEHNVIANPHDQTSAIIMWDEGDPQNRDVMIRNNLLAGGGYTLYCGRSGTAVNVVVTGNRFVPGQYSYSDACGSGGEVWSGNVLDATGAAIPAD